MTFWRCELKSFNQYYPGCVYFMAEVPKVLAESNDDMNIHAN